MGFTQFYNRTFSEYLIIDKIKPNFKTKFAFLGCRNVNDQNLQIGLFGNASFFFEQQKFSYNQTGEAIGKVIYLAVQISV